MVKDKAYWDEKARESDRLGLAECLRRTNCSCINAELCEARVEIHANSLHMAYESGREDKELLFGKQLPNGDTKWQG